MNFNEGLKILAKRYAYLKTKEGNYVEAELAAIRVVVAKALAVSELGYDSIKQLTADQVLNQYAKLYSGSERAEKKRFHNAIRDTSSLR